MASHFPTAVYLRDVLLPGGRLIGWNPGNFAGFPMFQFYFPLPFLIMVGMNLIMPLEVSFKLVSVLGIFLLPVASYFALRLMKQKFPVPILGALFSLPFLYAEGNSMWGGNILSNFAGEFNFQISFALGLLFMASVYRSMKDYGFLLINGLLLAVIGLTHGVGLLFGTVWMLFFLIQPAGIGKRIIYLARIYAVGVGLMAFWLFPFLAGTKWSTKFNLLWHFSGFKEVFPVILWPLLVVAVVGSLITFGYRVFKRFSRGENLPDQLGHLGFLWFGIVVGLVLFETGYELNVVDIRFLPYVEFLPMLIAAIVLGNFARKLRGTALFAIVIALATVIWVSHYTKSVSDWAKWNYSGFEGKPVWETYKAINTFLKGDASDPRVVYEHSPSYNKFGTLRAFENLPYFSGRSTLEGLYMQSSVTTPYIFYLQSEISSPGSAPLRQYDYTSLNLEKAIRHFSLFNIRHFITISDRVKRQAREIPSLESAAKFDDVEIFRVKPFENKYVEPLKYKPVVTDIDNWRYKSHKWFRGFSSDKPHLLFAEKDQKKDASIADLAFASSPENLPAVRLSGKAPNVTSTLYNDSIDINTDNPDWPLLVKVSYHPNWRAEGAIGPYLVSPSLMVIFPTQGKVRMYFSRSAAEWLGLAATLVTILICVVRIEATSWLLRREWEIPFLRLNTGQLKAIIFLCWAGGVFGFVVFTLYMRANSPERLELRAKNSYSSGDLDQAFRDYERLYQAVPESSYGDNASYFKAIIHFRQGNNKEALAAFRHLIARFPDSIFVPEAYYHIGLSEEAMGKPLAAQKTWTMVQRKFPGVKWAGYAAEKQAKIPPNTSLFSRAMMRFDQEKLKEAAGLFKKIEVSAPDLATRRNAAYFHAVSYFKMKDWRLCIEKFEHFVDEDEKNPWAAEAYYHIGLCQKELGNMDLAKSAFQQVVEKFQKTRWAGFAREKLNKLK